MSLNSEKDRNRNCTGDFFFHPVCLTGELTCPGADWYQFGQYCYKSFGDRRVWQDAKQACRSLKGDLASVRSIAEQTWLRSYLYMGRVYST